MIKLEYLEVVRSTNEIEYVCRTETFANDEEAETFMSQNNIVYAEAING